MSQTSLHDPASELTLREQTYANLALALSNNGALGKHEHSEHLRNDGLNEEEVAQVFKFAALFRFWQQQQQEQNLQVEQTTDQHLQPALFGGLPYFFEGTNPFAAGK